MDRIRPSAVALLAMVLLLGTVLDPLRAGQNPAAAASGFIWGRVVEGGTTTPVPGALVTLINTPAGGGRGEPAREVIADAQGRFVFSGLPRSEYRLRASRAGWQTGDFGVNAPMQEFGGGEVVSLGAGERRELNVPVW